MRRCNGACPCALDGRDIMAHAKAGYCPEKKYGDGIAPAGWDALPVVAIGDVPPPVPRLMSNGPGDVVKAVLSWLGYDAGTDCGCEAMRQQMNEWGWRGCWQRRHWIVAWFKARGKERGVALTAAGLFIELRRAMRERNENQRKES